MTFGEMRSWMILVVYAIVLIILALANCDDRPKRGDQYGFNAGFQGFVGGTPLGTHGGTDLPISTGFNCAIMPYPGLYADVNAGCKAFHICGAGSGSGSTFYCPKGTMFNQQHFVCDWWYNVNCAESPKYYNLNANLQGSHGGKSSHGVGKAQPYGQDVFQALYTAKESASIAATHAERAAQAANAAKSAAQAKQLSAQQQIHNIKAAAQAQLNAARRAAQIATSMAHSRAAAAERSAAAFQAEAYARANAAVNHAAALRVAADVKFAIAKAAEEANKKTQVANLHLAIQEESRQNAFKQQERAALALAQQHHGNSVNVEEIISNAAADANGQTQVANLHLAIQDEVRQKAFDHQERAAKLAQQRQGRTNLAAAVNRVIANAAADANGKAEVANLHLEIQEKVRQTAFDHQERAIQAQQGHGSTNTAATVGTVIANAAADASGKKNEANLYLDIQDKARQLAFAHKDRSGYGHRRHDTRAAVKDVVKSAAQVANKKMETAQLQLDILEKARQLANAQKQRQVHHRRHAKVANATAVTNSHMGTGKESIAVSKLRRKRGHPNSVDVLQIIHNAAADANLQAETASLYLDIREKQRQQYYNQHQMSAHHRRRHTVTTGPANSTKTDVTPVVQKSNSTSEKANLKDSGNQLRKTRGVNPTHNGNIWQIIADAAAEANGQVAVAKLDLEIQDKARQLYLARQNQNHGHYYRKRRSATGTIFRDDEKAGVQDKVEIGRQLEAGENVTADVQEKLNTETQKNLSRKIRGVNPNHNGNVWQIIADAAAEADGQTQVAKLDLAIQEEARQLYYRMANRAADHYY